VRVVIDDSDDKGDPESAESQAEARLVATAGRANVKRHHMGDLQHNKTAFVDGPQTKTVLCGSTNFSWRGFYVQNNNAMVVRGAAAVTAFSAAFEGYWHHDDVKGFGQSGATELVDLGLAGIDARVAFSPHTKRDALLADIATDIGTATSSVLYSMAFLSQTTGAVTDALEKVTKDPEIFVYGIADKEVGGIDLQTPDSNEAPAFPVALDDNVPEPFKSEAKGGGGIRMHHKFVVIDFDKPTARVWMGSYNFSDPADGDNGENLLIVKDRRIAVAYAVEALRIFDHYHFRAKQQEAGAPDALVLVKPPAAAGELPWWDRYYTEPQRIRDREMFA
jgi:phosphatidylserine/phosphatidylglycerophosphate/cardiolipin synthase-like enzyme